MMRQPGKWWPGLLIPIALWCLSGVVRQAAIEHDVISRTARKLGAADRTWVTVSSAGGRDVAIQGLAPSEADYADAIRIAREAWGVRATKRSGLRLMPAASPYIWMVSSDGDRITLEGSVPNELARTRLLALAARTFPNNTIVDELNLARGAPAGFDLAATTEMIALSHLKRGTASLSDASMAVDGQAIDFTHFDTVTASMRMPPPGFTARLNILPPTIVPFIWSARWGENKLVLEGYMPTDSTRTDLALTARQLFSGADIKDTSRLAQGAPSGDWPGAAAFGLSQLMLLQSGHARLLDNVLTVSGVRKLDQTVPSAGPPASLPAGFSYESNGITLPLVSPYRLTVSRRASGIELSGFAPSLGAKALAASVANDAAGSGVVKDDLAIAPGLPPSLEYDQALAFMVSVTAALRSGEARLTDGDLSVIGDAVDQATATALDARLHAPLPAGMRLASSQITTAPAPSAAPTAYNWSATIDPAGLTLAGNYPDEKSHREILDFSRRRIQGTIIVDHMQVATGAPRRFMDGLSVALRQLARLSNGMAKLDGTKVVLSGEALLASAANDIDAATSAALPDGWTTETKVVPAPPEAPLRPDACQQSLSSLLQSGQIYFDNGKADIDVDARGLLDRLTATVRRCPDAKIEVAGHTDTDGSAAFNQDLSERRAYAVVDYLIRNGTVDSSRLSAVGYGFSRPVASNETEEGKARNRRIVFTVK